MAATTAVTLALRQSLRKDDSEGYELRSLRGGQSSSDAASDQEPMSARTLREKASKTAADNLEYPAIIAIVDTLPEVNKFDYVDIVYANDRQNLWRSKVYIFFEDPNVNRFAKYVSWWVIFLILLSVTAFIVVTLPEFHLHEDDTVWSVIEWICVINFTIEYLFRICVCPRLWKFVKAPLNVVDLVAILPFYIQLLMPLFSGSEGGVGSSFVFFRILRLARVFRVFKLSRYSSGLKMLGRAMYSSLAPLGLLVFFLSIAVIVFSSLMFFAERGTIDPKDGLYYRDYNGDKGDASPFQSIPACFWWCIVTMTTVGYGDIYPVTDAGKIVATMTMLLGILVIALPVSIIGANFQGEYEGQAAARSAQPQSAQNGGDDFTRITAKQNEMENCLKAIVEQCNAARSIYNSLSVEIEELKRRHDSKVKSYRTLERIASQNSGSEGEGGLREGRGGRRRSSVDKGRKASADNGASSLRSGVRP
eukprot:GFYU01004218.1.p1 GENE.GFYU01004218.1~~GFYU01004218.1.p1  ORF type:complete len:477 (-),score=71.49 GFYU01004218.1:296-1726(-)